VIVFRTLGAPRLSSSRGRRPKPVEPGASDPEPVPISRVTVIGSTGFEDETAAGDWLERCRKDEDEREEHTANALLVVNRAIRAYRVSAADPYERELSRERVRAVRLGYGTGDDLVEGRWSAAYTLPSPRARARRRQMLAPQEQLAAILSGRSPVHPSEDLALRARLDLDQGRSRESALQLRAAIDALESEGASADAAQRTGERSGGLSELRAEAESLAASALTGELNGEQVSSLADLIDQIERRLRRRRHAG
jgi:hypothetical protein